MRSRAADIFWLMAAITLTLLLARMGGCNVMVGFQAGWGLL